jgi:hypothetical protein
MEDVHEKACSDMACWGEVVTKASKTMAAAEVMCHALNQ